MTRQYIRSDRETRSDYARITRTGRSRYDVVCRQTRGSAEAGAARRESATVIARKNEMGHWVKVLAAAAAAATAAATASERASEPTSYIRSVR